MKEFVRVVRQTDPSFQYAYGVETNPRQAMIHTHGYFYTSGDGKNITNKVIDNARRTAGFGTFKKGEVWPDAKPEYFAYALKTLASPELHGTFMDLNGTPGHRSLIHAHGFWRDGVGGETLSRKEAHRIVTRRMRGQQYSPQEIADLIKTAMEEAA